MILEQLSVADFYNMSNEVVTLSSSDSDDDLYVQKNRSDVEKDRNPEFPNSDDEYEYYMTKLYQSSYNLHFLGL